jgi:hypothetical protein
MTKTGSPLSCNSLANSCTCNSIMSYQQNHYKYHLTWNIHGLVNGPLLSWKPSRKEYVYKHEYSTWCSVLVRKWSFVWNQSFCNRVLEKWGIQLCLANYNEWLNKYSNLFKMLINTQTRGCRTLLGAECHFIQQMLSIITSKVFEKFFLRALYGPSKENCHFNDK